MSRATFSVPCSTDICSNAAKEKVVKGLDARHREEAEQISDKHGNTKMKNLKSIYPELKNFRNEDTLGKVRERQGVESLDALIKKVRTKQKH
jgi:hypothetical protein